VIPRVVRLVSLDGYRDGGSIGASYESDDQLQCSLIFRIAKKYSDPGGPTYRAPVLDVYIPSPYTSPVSGVTHSDWKRDSFQLSLEQAADILRAMKPMLQSIDKRFCEFEALEALASGSSPS
jgi:hypothetical protein